MCNLLTISFLITTIAAQNLLQYAFIMDSVSDTAVEYCTVRPYMTDIKR
jgi:hypothetical protein